MMKNTSILIPIFALMAFANKAGAEPKGWRDYVKVDVTTTPYIDSNFQTNINNSHVGLTVENQNLRSILTNLGIESYSGIDFIMSFKIRISAVPTLLQNSVQSQLDARVDEKVKQGFQLIDSKVSAGYLQVDQAVQSGKTQVDQFGASKLQELQAGLAQQKPLALQAAQDQALAALNANPNYELLPPDQQATLTAQALATASAGVDEHFQKIEAAKTQEIAAAVSSKKTQIEQLGLAKKNEISNKGQAAKSGATQQGIAKKEEISKRLDEINLETTVQEVSLLIGKVITNGHALVYIKVGKFHPETAGQVNSNYQTHLETLRPVNSSVQRGTGIAPTGAVNLGTNLIIAKGKQIQFDIILAHERPPWVDGEQYIGTVVSQTPDQFEQQKAFYNINSVIARALFKNNRGEIYGTFGSYDGKSQSQVGARIVVTETTSFHVDYTIGSRGYLKEGVSAFVVYRIHPRLQLYAGGEYIRGQKLPGKSAREDGTIDRTTGMLGGSWEAFKYETRDWGVDVRVSAELQHQFESAGYATDYDQENDLVLGGQVNAWWK